MAKTATTITFDGDTKVADAGASVVFTGTKNVSAVGTAVTSGKTTTGTLVGLQINWTLSNTYPATGNTTIDLNVSSEYFFVYVTNTSTKQITKVYVNHGLQNQTLDNLTLASDGLKYSIGYYKAFSNSNVRLESGTSFWKWESTDLKLPFTLNQSVSLAAL